MYLLKVEGLGLGAMQELPMGYSNIFIIMRCVFGTSWILHIIFEIINIHNDDELNRRREMCVVWGPP